MRNDAPLTVELNLHVPPPPHSPGAARSQIIWPGSGDEVLTEAEQAAWAAVDHALVVAKDDTATAEKKVFSELEGVDKAVSAACSSVIRVLLQVRARDLRFFRFVMYRGGIEKEETDGVQEVDSCCACAVVAITGLYVPLCRPSRHTAVMLSDFLFEA